MSRIHLIILDELVDLLKQRVAIPNEDEYPRICPKLKDYHLPSYIYSSDYLNKCLSDNCIDFKSHGYAGSWDRHWKTSNWHWFLLRGNRPYLINRQPFSIHKKLLEKYQFKLLCELPTIKEKTFPDKRINKKFSFVSKKDRQTSGVFIQVVK